MLKKDKNSKQITSHVVRSFDSAFANELDMVFLNKKNKTVNDLKKYITKEKRNISDEDLKFLTKQYNLKTKPIKIKKRKGGMLQDDREKYIAGGLARIISKVTKKKVPVKATEKDVDKLLKGLTEADMEKLSPAEIEQLMDLQIEKYGVDNIPAKSSKKDIDDILDNLTDKELENLTPIEREQLLDMQLKKYGKEGRKPKMSGGMLEDDMSRLGLDKGGMLPDNDMEDNYTRFIMEEALSEDEEDMLTSKLEQDEQLSMLFDKIIDVAQEFAGSGPVEGPGSGVSDSIPARLSDGEFVFTAKAVEEIGADKLMSMMKEAEAAAEGRQQAYGGGVMGDQLEKVVSTETRITKPADAMSPALGAKEDNMIQEEVTRNMLDPRVPHVRS